MLFRSLPHPSHTLTDLEKQLTNIDIKREHISGIDLFPPPSIPNLTDPSRPLFSNDLERDGFEVLGSAASAASLPSATINPPASLPLATSSSATIPSAASLSEAIIPPSDSLSSAPIPPYLYCLVI